MHHNSEVYGLFRAFHVMIQNQFEYRFHCIRIDNGSEFTNNNMRNYLLITWHTTLKMCVHTPPTE